MRAPMNTRLRASSLTLLFCALAATPLLAAAHDATSTVRDAIAPVGMVSAGAGELASFALSAVALVVAGIALARTRRF